MNEDLAKIVTCYATRPHEELSELLLSKSKDNLIANLTDLVTAYINDSNSSSLREFVTVIIAGYEHNPKKLGYNGFKQDSAIGGKPVACEAKPKNIQTLSIAGFPLPVFFPNIQNHLPCDFYPIFP